MTLRLALLRLNFQFRSLQIFKFPQRLQLMYCSSVLLPLELISIPIMLTALVPATAYTIKCHVVRLILVFFLPGRRYHCEWKWVRIKGRRNTPERWMADIKSGEREEEEEDI